MSTITTAVAGVVVVGLVLGMVTVYVRVLANLASRNGQSLSVEFDARRPRLNVHVNPSAQSRDATPLVAPVDGAPSEASEKTS
jgi:hypothetical protein